MRVELKIYLFSIPIAIILKNIVGVESPIGHFIVGFCFAICVVLWRINVLPEKDYENLLYRQFIKK